MNYKDCRKFLEGLHTGEIHLALDRIQELLRRLGNPQEQVPYVHIAGTNGKGSILAYISAALTRAGYKTGRYSSPVVYEYGEQFQIDGKNISREKFIRYTEEVADAVRQMESDGWVRPSSFELETSLAFLYFAREGCEIGVMECGMGGRDDATNVIAHPLAAVFASISLDHSAFLGRTTAEIARTKAGIMRPGAAAVTSDQTADVMEVLREEAEKNGCTYVYADRKRAGKVSIDGTRLSFPYTGCGGEETEIEVQLPGICQVVNALTAYETLKFLQRSGRWERLTDAAIHDGMKSALWPGRFCRIGEKPDFIVDGAHNPGAASALKSSIETYLSGRRLIFIIGMFKDKDYDTVLRILAPMAAQVFAIETPDNPRALPVADMAAAVARYNPHVEACASISEAVERAYQAAGPEDAILSFGSLSNIGEISRLAGSRHPLIFS